MINDFFTDIGPQLGESLPAGVDPHTRTVNVRTLRFDPTITCNLVAEFVRT